uniref:SH3 domain-containing protein n=1 Tax=Ascaris lumbricoides TaxID=6252 RepID=A0A0M3HZ79_ASCLU
MTQVRAVYEFEAQPNSGELSISVDEVLTVLREGIEGGWLEGRNSRGQLGLFPESYVVKIDPTAAAPVCVFSFFLFDQKLLLK